ncbi:MAG TPA: heme o synthase [Myxococcales bacterium]|nr:heme o synthase [Myxococcales bacterium]
MEAVLPAVAPRPATLRDLVALTKPRVTGLVIATTATGVCLAPGHLSAFRVAVTLLGTALVVGAANTLNCWLERDVDARMLRTRGRPLAARRLSPATALWVGFGLAAVSIPALAFFVNPLTGLLAALALVSYVWVYTPLKRITPKALAVGAVPGAIPPLLGWTAVEGHLGAPGVWLFLVLFLWQLPHFLAITLYLQDDYARGGLRVLPLVKGEKAARRQLLYYTAALLPLTLWVRPLGLTGKIYFPAAAVLGVVFVALAWRGLSREALEAPPAVRARWARRLFAYSIVYLMLLSAALLADARGLL